MLACSLVTRTFFEIRFDLGTLDSGERSLPFGLLVCLFLAINVRQFHSKQSNETQFLTSLRSIDACPDYLKVSYRKQMGYAR